MTVGELRARSQENGTPREGVPAPGAVPLSLNGVSKRWRKDLPPVLTDVDLVLDIGTRTWVGGRNGAGKTTLLRIAAGLIDPDRGSGQRLGLRRRRAPRAATSACVASCRPATAASTPA